MQASYATDVALPVKPGPRPLRLVAYVGALAVAVCQFQLQVLTRLAHSPDASHCEPLHSELWPGVAVSVGLEQLKFS